MEKLCFLLITITLLTFSLYAQSKSDWIRVESNKKEFSIVVPTDSLTDSTKRNGVQTFRSFGVHDGVEVDVIEYRGVRSMENAQRDSLRANFVQLKEFRGFAVVHYQNDLPSGLTTVRVNIFKRNLFYVIRVTALPEQKSKVAGVLASIRIEGHPYFQTEGSEQPDGEVVGMTKLGTSNEFDEAWARKSEEIERKIAILDISSEQDVFETKGLTRRSIVVAIPDLRITNDVLPSLRGAREPNAVMVVTLLASGQVGDIKVLRAVVRGFGQSCANSYKKMKFVPAQIDGKYVDSVRVFQCNAPIATIVRSRP